MSSGRSDIRMAYSGGVAILLLTAYFGYSALLSPLLDVKRREQPGSPLRPESSQPSSAKELARHWFPADSWVARCGNDLHDGQRYLYYETSTTTDDGYTLKATPVALLWLDEHPQANSVPVTVLADGARLRTSEKLSLDSGGIGRIVGGVLDGSVRVRGPRNLRIDGDTFSISEDSLTLTSSHPVKFGWEDHIGEAASGVEIVMHTPQEGLQRDGLLSVSDVSEVRLNGRVSCNMVFRARRADEEDIRIRVTAADGFKFDVDTRIATFYGLHKRSQSSGGRPQDQVHVTRFASDGTKDQLVCSQLKMVFRPEVSAVTGEVQPGRLRLEHVIAEGEQVVFQSEAHGVTAWMTELAYFVDERRIQMRNTNRNAEDRPLPVAIKQDGSLLRVSELQILHSAAGDVQRLECRGPGIVWHEQSVNAGVMSAHWLGSMMIHESADGRQRVIQLNGDAGVGQSQLGFELSARQIVMKLRNEATAAASGVPPATREANADPLDLRSLRPEELTATGNVFLKSPDANGTIRQQLTVKFDPSVANALSDAASSSDTAVADSNPATELADGTGQSEPPVAFSADILQATVRQAAVRQNSALQDTAGRGTAAENAANRSRRMQLANVWLTGQVELVRQDVDPDKSFTASGNSLQAFHGLHDTREIKLFGDPASIVVGRQKLEGKRIDVDEGPGSLKVDGSGRLRMVTDQGFDGKLLPHPTPMDIYWSEVMSFQGREAHFVGNIRVVMKDGQTQDLELTCAGLKVFFNREIALGGNPADRSFSVSAAAGDTSGQQMDIVRIECESVVNFRLDELLDGTVRARHRARVVDLKVDTETGDFHALGPGWISSTTPDTEGPLQTTATASARANAPARIDGSAFVFVKAEFIGDLTGNLQQQNATLAHHVRGIFAPVRDIGEQVSVDTVPTDQLPDNVGILRAEKLEAAAIPATGGQPDSFSLTASDNARIESRPFSGNADVITYDHSKQQFILRAEGNRTASVRYRAGISGEYANIDGRRFEYYSATNRLAFNSISSISGVTSRD